MLGGVLSPLLRDPPRDDFPLSSYPMFSKPPKAATARVPHVVAVSREGRHRPVGPGLVGTEEVLQAHQTIDVAIRRGEAEALCQRLARSVASDASFGDVEALEIRTDVFDVFSYFEGDRRPLRTRVHGRCAVEPEAPG